MPASERKGDVLRFSSVQYILVLHFQISKSNHPNCNSKLLTRICIYKSISKILLHAPNSKLNQKNSWYLGNEELVNHSTLSVMNGDSVGRDRRRVAATGWNGDSHRRLQLWRCFAATFQGAEAVIVIALRRRKSPVKYRSPVHRSAGSARNSKVHECSLSLSSLYRKLSWKGIKGSGGDPRVISV